MSLKQNRETICIWERGEEEGKERGRESESVKSNRGIHPRDVMQVHKNVTNPVAAVLRSATTLCKVVVYESSAEAS